MTNKRKKLACALSHESGLSHQAAMNALNQQQWRAWRGSREGGGRSVQARSEANYREMLACYFWDLAQDLHDAHPVDCRRRSDVTERRAGDRPLDRVTAQPANEHVDDDALKREPPLASSVNDGERLSEAGITECRSGERLLYHPVSEQLANRYVAELERRNERSFASLREEAVRLSSAAPHSAEIGFSSWLGHRMIGDHEVDEDEREFPPLFLWLQVPEISRADQDVLRAAARNFCETDSLMVALA